MTARGDAAWRPPKGAPTGLRARHFAARGAASTAARVSQRGGGEGFVLVREVVEPVWEPYRPGRLPGGVARRRGAGLVRLTHVGDEPVVVAVAGKVFAARAATEAAAREGIARMRFATGID